MSYARIVWAHLAKDLRLEWRSKDAINGMLFFSLLVVVLFSFAFDPTMAASRRIAGGILWVALLFASTTALNQTWTPNCGIKCSTRSAWLPAQPAHCFWPRCWQTFSS